MLTVFSSSCATVSVDINRDGSGTAIVNIAKTEGLTKEGVEKIFSKISKGVDSQSGDDDRLKLKSVKENSNGFEVTVSFRRINYTKGLGYFDYMKSSDFASEQNKREMVENYDMGVYSNYTNYAGHTYKFNNATRPNKNVAFSPINRETGETLDYEEFVKAGGVLSEKKNGMMFTFFVVDLLSVAEYADGMEIPTDISVESITFSIKGKIKIYGSKNIEIVDDDTFKVYPVTQKGKYTYYETETSTDPIQVEKDFEVFAGYVYFELAPNWLLIGILIGIGAILISFLVWGIVSGGLKKILKSKRATLIFRNYDLYLMMLPALILLILFAYTPMTGVIMAFKNHKIDDGIFGSEWAAHGGFKHFIDLILTQPGADFGKLARNTVILAGLKFIFGFVCAIVLAVLFSYLKNGGFKKTVQTISYFPYFISWVVVSSIVYLFLASATGTSAEAVADQGILNRLIIAFGGTPITWYSSPQYWRTILTFTAMWKTVGYSTIVYLAAITSINPSLYEAASIDGAGRVKQLWHVTLPGLFPVLGVQVIFSLGNLVKDDFDQIYTLTNGSPSLSETTEVIGTIVYKSIASPSSYSSAAAMGLMQGVVGLILVLTSNKILKKLGIDGVF